MPGQADAAGSAWGVSSSAVVCLVLSLLAFAWSFALGVQAPARLLAPETLLFWTDAGNGWFQSDALRVLGDMSDWDADHSRARVHPIFSLLVLPVVTALRALLSIDARTAAALFSGATAAASAALMFLTLRRLGRSLAEAALLCLLMLASAAWLFFYTVPETFQLGALSILLALFVAAGPPAASPRREALRQLLVSAATLSITVTNWMFGWLLAAARLRWFAALAATAGAFALVAALAWVQLQWIPTTSLFTGGTNENSYILKEDAGGPLLISKVFWLDTVVAPRPEIVGGNPYWQGLSMQRARPGSGSPLGVPALLLWAGLLGSGALALLRSGAPRAFKWVLAGGLAGQWALHLIYGEETFLYALHFLPLLVLLASLGFERPGLRRPLLGALALLVAAAGYHNSSVLAQSAEHIAAQGSPRTALLEEMARRPLGPWPRGRAHLLLGVPGAPLADKGYLEPAGAFSPWVGSFGLSFWITDAEGTLLQAAERIPLHQTRQQLRLEGGRWPGADFSTPLYAGRWQQTPEGAWQLALGPSTLPAGQRRELVLRAVGPAAGPVYRLQRRNGTLLVNGRWVLELPPGSELRLGDEQQGFDPGPGAVAEVESAGGWAFARAVLPDAPEARVLVRPLQAAPPPAGPALSLPALKLPDPDFAASVQAQLQHLAMSVEGRETRPGDPLNYGAAWARDSAHIVAALARAGNLALARRLAADLAERDFFGGFGSETDAPGSALWALEEVASRLADPAYDREIWPHVRRKAEWLLGCLDASSALLAEPQGPILRRYARTRETELACLPDPGDLIAGRMDWLVPRLYLTAVAYRGLADAAALARRLGETGAAGRWSAAAARLQAAWNAQMKAAGTGRPGFGELRRWMGAGAAAQGFYGARNVAKLWAGSRAAGGDLQNPRSYINALWPTRVADDGARQEFAERLRARGVPGPRPGLPLPKWTYFDVAEAHQWLLLGEPQRAWETLRRYWDHQVAPGAYSWWEGDGEENTSHGWEAVHGWVEPPHVTPHYWTAAEVLALQLDMLTRLDERGAGPVVEIGAGVPPEWLEQPMAAGGIALRGAWVDWRWQDGRMDVTVTGRRYPVRLAEVFPAGTPLAVRHVDGPAPRDGFPSPEVTR